jgi:signal transduction histidine kinase
LTRAEEVRSSFLAVVSHELRTPLTVLKGFVDTLLARWDHLEDQQRQQLVERLGPQVRRLHRGVDRLLVAADIQRGAHLRVTNEPLALADVVGDVVDGFRPLAPLHTFNVDVAPEVAVVADRKALAQALDQLVDNAVKYSPSGGSVVVRAQSARRRVELAVEDEGVGLPSDFSRILEPLTQGEEVDGRVHDEGGVGVGLYIARAMVEAMGGSVRAERRRPEPGTRLVVTLVAGPLRAQGGAQLAPSGRVHGR